MTEEVNKFNSYSVWRSHDKTVTGNSIRLELFNTRNEYGVSTLGATIFITNTESKLKTSFFLDYKQVFIITYAFDQISRDLGEYQKKIVAEPGFQKVIKTASNKKKFSLTYMKHESFTNPVIRLSISSSEDANLESATLCYIDMIDMLSLMTLLTEFKNHYLSISTNMLIRSDTLELIDGSTSVSHKLSSFYSELRSGRTGKSADELINKDEYIAELKATEPEALPEVGSIDTDDIHKEMDAYVDENKDTIKADGLDGIPTPESDTNKPVGEKTVIKAGKDTFTDKFLNGCSYDLEITIASLKSVENPFDKLCTLIQNRLDVTREKLLPGCSDADYKSLCYITSRHLTHTLNIHINNSAPLSVSVIPTAYDAPECDHFNRNLLYDIFLYFLVYNQIYTQCKDRQQNTTHNKGLVTFTMKVLLSPFIFSFLKHVESEEILVRETVNRFNEYRENKVFELTYTKLKEHFGTDIVVSTSMIEKAASSVYKNTLDKLPKFYIDERWTYVMEKTKSIVVPHALIKRPDVDLEQINSILRLEVLRKNKSKVNLSETKYEEKDFKHVIPDIAKVFGLDVGPDISNLRKLANNLIKDNPDTLQLTMDIIDQIGGSYHDLAGKSIDFSQLPDVMLVALAIWDTDADPKLKRDYNYMLSKIKESKLDHALALSILATTEERIEEDFSGSLEVTN